MPHQTLLLKKCLFSLSCLFLFACSPKEELEKSNPATYSLSGKVEKGPFISGSTVYIQSMNQKLQTLGSMYSTTITDNTGSFVLDSKEMESPYAELTANGYFFNEVKGELSKGTLTLRALVDLSDQRTVNVNLLTHLKYPRIQKLVKEGVSFQKANQQAQKELFSAFGLQRYADTDASLFSITSGTEEGSALIAISSLLLAERTEAELTEFLAFLSAEFGQLGDFSAESKSYLHEGQEELIFELETIADNICKRYEELGMNVKVQPLAPFFDWDGDGTAGNELLQEGQQVKPEKEELEIPNEGGVYQIAIDSPISLYLNIPEGAPQPPISISGIVLYENNEDISLEKEMQSGKLKIEVSPLKSCLDKTLAIPLYDCLGNQVATIRINQRGNHTAKRPPLSQYGAYAINEMYSIVGNSLANISMLEQLYHYNPKFKLVKNLYRDRLSNLYDGWDFWQRGYNYNCQIKEIDASQGNISQLFTDVNIALLYYYTVVIWGDMPYYQFTTSTERMDATLLLNKMKTLLEAALPTLDEKKNASPLNTRDLFYASKDVVRILLANIHLYQGAYNQASSLLSQVVQNGFYSLDGTNYSQIADLDRIYTENGGNEVIFALRWSTWNNSVVVDPNLMLYQPKVIPLMNYTDVILSYAESLFKSGREGDARSYLNQVCEAKGVALPQGEVLTGIKEVRKELLLYGLSNFAFMKRNNLALEEYAIDPYQLLMPFPSQLPFQNPGWY